MEIVLVAAVVIGILDYLLLMPGRRDDRDDEEQIQYLKGSFDSAWGCEVSQAAGKEEFQRTYHGQV